MKEGGRKTGMEEEKVPDDTSKPVTLLGATPTAK